MTDRWLRAHVERELARIDARITEMAPKRIEGARHFYTLSDSEVVVSHPNHAPVIYNFETGKARKFTDVETTTAARMKPPSLRDEGAR